MAACAANRPMRSEKAMSQPEPETVEDRLRAQIEAYHDAALAYGAVKLGLPETMGAEAWTAERLAAALGLSAPHLSRMLKGLATQGLVAARSDGAFTLTDAGRALSPGSGSTLREKLLIVVEQYWQPWAHLAACVETGTPAFDLVFGAPVGDWRRTHPKHGEAFESYLGRENFAGAGPVLDMLDVSGVKTVADLGGGHGGLLAAILTKHPHLRGVLFTQPLSSMAAKAYLESMNVADRVALVGVDIAQDIPVDADMYVLKSVLQRHDDTQARKILENCRFALTPGAKLIVVERLMPEHAMGDPAAIMLDLHMMAITGGKTRTKAEMEALIAEAGLRIAACSKTSDGLAFIELTSP